MLTTSSCGTRMSSRAFGHTGFTGTSLWLDPEAEVYVVLLTNRVHPTPANEASLAVRPAFHDAVMADLSWLS
jgi:CubicO group peptidase (beta-lactamase class C family)